MCIRDRYISVMVQNTKRLLELTGQLLDFQKIGANKLTMKFESVDITELLAGIVARFEVTFSLNRKELQLKSTDEQVWAAVDKEAITKIPVSYTHLDVYKRQEYYLIQLYIPMDWL